MKRNFVFYCKEGGGFVMSGVASSCSSGLNVYGDQSSWFMCVAQRGHLMAFGIKVVLGI